MLKQAVALTELCKSAIAAGKTLRKWASSDLKDREKLLLTAAAESGRFEIGQSEIDGVYVMAGVTPFAEPDPRDTAHFFDAFTSLCDRGLIIASGDGTFRLTGQGFDIARRFAERVR